MATPSFDKVRELVSQGYNLIPLWREVVMDLDTPVSLFAKIGKGRYSFLLESLEGGERWGRYSFIGLRPLIVFRSKGERVEVEKGGRVEERRVQDPLEALKELLAGFQVPHFPELPRFPGGAVGYLSYDMVRFMERLPRRLEDTQGFHDALFMVPELLLVHDNLRQSLFIIAWMEAEGQGEEGLEARYSAAAGLMDSVIHQIRQGLPYPAADLHGHRPPELGPEVDQERFMGMVERAKEYIRAGDIIQVVLSQRFSGTNHLPPFAIYRALRRINPSPYLYFLTMGDEVLIGSSPEILVRLTGREIYLRPIAGTRPRGRTPEEDRRLREELLADPKERAEHLMLVDLGRNDVGRVAELGSVVVEDLMTIEYYSHVMHIVSGVKGRLAQGRDMFDVIRATFPAGTVSGAPKIRAMEIIEELEHATRGPYAGAVGYLGFNGNMDLAITIRTLCQKGDRLFLQAGAGIVADSDPQREWQETINKGRAMMKAVEEAALL